jgi:hypothetical protein
MLCRSSRVFTTAIAATVFLVGWANGGFSASAWGWIAFLFSCATAFALLQFEPRAPRMLLAWGGAITLFVVWTMLSLLWTPDVTTGVQNVQRDLVYLSAALLAITIAHAATPVRLRDGVLIGASALCVFGLAKHLTPDVFGVSSQASVPGRLYSPLGYWNAQGMLAVLAVILAAGVVSADRSALRRAIAGGVIPVLAVEILFTLSRGAELALVFGIIMWLVIDPKRLEATVWLAVVALGAGIATWQANRTPALFGEGYGLTAAPAAHRLEFEIVAICLATGCCVYAMARIGPLVMIPRWVRSSYVSLLCAGAVLCLSAAVHQYGNPASWPGTAYRSFTAAPTVKQDDPSRLLTFSLTNRDLLWSVAWREGTSHPVQGTGAGSFDEYWYRNRTAVMDSGSAHSLYLETFGETGAVGLLLLTVTLMIPVLAGIRARFSPAVPSMVGAVAGFLLHAGTDWDWLVPGLTLPTILCSAALLASCGGVPSVLLAAKKRRFLVACAGVVAVVAALGLAGNQLLLDSYDAANRGDFRAAERDASRAARWQPWSFLPWMQIGNARSALGDVAGARRAYETAASREPDRPEPWIALAETSSGRQRELAVRRAQELNPIGPEVIMLCGIDDRACTARRGE